METSRPNDEQSALWNGPSGRAWVDTQAPIDRMFEPLEKLLADAVAKSSARSVLDVGCGTGAVTLAIARRLGADAQCTGIDISARMIDAARARAERSGVQARFVCADVQTHAFEPASVDLIVSRLGVMFFDDPVRAFANLRHAARPNAQMRFIAWRSAADNPFMTIAEQAAAPLLPNLPARRAGAIRVRRTAADRVGTVGQWLGGHRDRAGRSGVRAARARAGRLHLAARPGRAGVAGGGRGDPAARGRHDACGVLALRGWRRCALRRGVLARDGARTVRVTRCGQEVGQGRAGRFASRVAVRAGRSRAA